MMGDVKESLPTGDALDDGWIADAMTLAQEFASSWSLVGGRFDDGTMLLSAEQRKSELRACLVAAALRSRQQVADGFERIAWQRVGADGTPLPIFVSRGEHLSPVCNYRDVFAASKRENWT